MAPVAGVILTFQVLSERVGSIVTTRDELNQEIGRLFWIGSLLSCSLWLNLLDQ
jgi:hypothetical protein